MGVIADIVICVIFAIALLIGVLRGFSKQFSRPLLVILSFVAAISLVALLYPLFADTSLMVGIIQGVSSWFSKPMYSVELMDAESLRQTVSGSYLAIFSPSADSMFNRMQNMLGKSGLPITFGNFFGKIIVNVVTEFLMWLLLYIAIKYLLKGVKYLSGKITQVVVFKTIDRVLGAVWAVALTYCIVIGIILTVVELLVSLSSGTVYFVTNLLDGSTILKFLHNTNLLGSFIAKLFGKQLIVLH